MAAGKKSAPKTFVEKEKLKLLRTEKVQHVRVVEGDGSGSQGNESGETETLQVHYKKSGTSREKKALKKPGVATGNAKGGVRGKGNIPLQNL